VSRNRVIKDRLSKRVDAVRGITLVERSDGMSGAPQGAICSSPAEYFPRPVRAIRRRLHERLHERREPLSHWVRVREGRPSIGANRETEEKPVYFLRKPPRRERDVAIRPHSTRSLRPASSENPLLRALLIPLRLRT